MKERTGTRSKLFALNGTRFSFLIHFVLRYRIVAARSQRGYLLVRRHRREFACTLGAAFIKPGELINSGNHFSLCAEPSTPRGSFRSPRVARA